MRQRTGLFAPSAPRLSSLIPHAGVNNAIGGNSNKNTNSNSIIATSTFETANDTAAARSDGVARVGGGGVIEGGGSEEGRVVALLRVSLARVRLEEDRAARAEVRAGLMKLPDPSSLMPVRTCHDDVWVGVTVGLKG